ncbi:site-specific integrase [Siphonobacter sp. SORGH_AS_0500]|uniref:site-specific integrase n=1 Tax=Siphonobacter sp. SORGH_AS_0500 TaxID=1864824 RepID=UPI00286A0A60|nr:site-specific integrase [Siphonobacter sp. SORGH_AS_0500]
MSDISITPELNSKKLKDGTQRIQLRITQNKKHRRVATEYSVHEKFWNTDKHEVRKGHPIASAINAAIREKVNKLMSEVSKADVQNKSISARDLQRKARNEVVGESFLTFAEKYVKRIANASSRDKVQSVLNKLKKYLDQQDLLFAEITYEFISSYQRYMVHTLGNSASTASKNLENIKVIYFEAVNSDVFDPPKDPWLKIKFTRGKVTPKAKLTLKEVERMAAEDFSDAKSLFHARNIFVLMFYSRGMRIRDALELKWKMVKPDKSRFTYVMSKTGKEMDILITEPIRKILEEYFSQQVKPGDYVFPFLSQNPRKLEHHKLVQSWTAEINGLLKEVAREVGIEKHISTHVARHSFAEVSRELTGNDIYSISAGLGHSSVSITEGYFNKELKTGADKLSQIVAPVKK